MSETVAYGHKVRAGEQLLPLLTKEPRGSRGILIAGLWSFWLMPVLLDTVYMLALERAPKTSGLLWVMLQWVGWFYAVVVGSQVVCRDWGQAEEHFLRAQPVSPIAIVFAKFLAGLCVVCCVAAASLAWSVPFNLRDPTPLMKVNASTMITLMINLLVGYCVAFAAAFVSRQILTGIVMGATFLALWWIGPWISHSLDFLNPTFFVTSLTESKDIPASVTAFIVTMMSILVFSPLVALITAQREISFRLNSKVMAATLSGLILGLFLQATTEVGNSLTILDQTRPPAGVPIPYPWSPDRYEMASSGNTAFFATESSISRVEMTKQGKFADVQAASLNSFLNQNDVGSRKSRVLHVSAPSQNEVIVTLAMEWVLRSSGGEWKFEKSVRQLPESVRNEGPMVLCRLRLAWPAHGSPKLLSSYRLVMPAEANSFFPIAAVSGERFTYVLLSGPSIHTEEGKLLAPETQPESPYFWPRLLYVLDWDGQQDEPPYRSATPSRALGLTMVHGRLALFRWGASSEERSYPGAIGTVAIFDADHPQDVLDSFRTGKLVPAPFFWTELVFFEKERFATLAGSGTKPYSEAFDIARQLIFVSTPDTLQAYNAKREVLGEYEFGWLSALFRQNNMRSKLMSDRRLADIGNSALTIYDVSDPRRIRRIGFHNLAQGWLAEAFPVAGHILLMESDLPTVLAMP